ncbi:MAG: tetratricopeptide repeat protein, partial [Candidatus Gastranaerophilales bacterium]|nr:tetratricopeptide repeat protein [Candidatus Gastranaerophilales bacterium]
LLNIEPSNHIALTNLGSIYFYKNDFYKSVNYYSRAAGLGVDNFSLYFNLGNAYAELGEFKQAMSNYIKALNMDKTNSQVYSAIGMLYQDKENFEESAIYYEKALKLENSIPDNYTNLAFVLMKLGKNLQAVKLFDNVLEMYPDNPLYILYCANANSAAGEYDRANRLFEQVINNIHNYYQAYICYGISLYEQNNIEKAIDMYNEAIMINPEITNGYILLGNLYSSLNQYENALELYNKVIEIEPANANAYILSGNTYVMLKDLRSAIASYKQAIDIDYENDELKLIYIEIVQEFIISREEKDNENAA